MRILPGHTVPHMDMDDGGAGLIDRDGVLDDLIHSDGEGRKFLLAGDGARQGTGDNYFFHSGFPF